MEDLMKTNITQALVAEHSLILRMIALLEQNAGRTVTGAYANWQFYLDGVDFIRKHAMKNSAGVSACRGADRG